MGFFSNLFGKKEKFDYEELFDFSEVRNDMHSHFLFGIDDGAKTLEDSINMIKGMKEMGYKKLITTPHIMADTYRNTPTIINEKLEIVRTRLQKENVDIEIYAAAEYYCDHEFFNMINSEELLTISSDKHLLFEVSYLNAPENFDDVIFALQSNGYRPILAHPERYPFWFNNFDKFKEIRNKGVALQVNINSLSGYYGPATKKISERLIDENMVSFLGSDCHHDGHQNLMKQALKVPHLSKLIHSGMLQNLSLS
jgi:tyrosine-protein phosphatase YwqE